MSFFFGLALWMGVGVVLMLWASDAERKWQALLTSRGLMPKGSDSPASAALHPASFFRRRWAYLSVAYPRTLRTSDPEVETWRLRRSRRRRLFIAWMFGGLFFAVSTIAVLDQSQESMWWLALLAPIAVALAYSIWRGYVYGSAVADVMR